MHRSDLNGIQGKAQKVNAEKYIKRIEAVLPNTAEYTLTGLLGVVATYLEDQVSTMVEGIAALAEAVGMETPYQTYDVLETATDYLKRDRSLVPQHSVDELARSLGIDKPYSHQGIVSAATGRFRLQAREIADSDQAAVAKADLDVLAELVGLDLPRGPINVMAHAIQFLQAREPVYDELGFRRDSIEPEHEWVKVSKEAYAAIRQVAYVGEIHTANEVLLAVAAGVSKTSERILGLEMDRKQIRAELGVEDGPQPQAACIVAAQKGKQAIVALTELERINDQLRDERDDRITGLEQAITDLEQMGSREEDVIAQLRHEVTELEQKSEREERLIENTERECEEHKSRLGQLYRCLIGFDDGKPAETQIEALKKAVEGLQAIALNNRAIALIRDRFGAPGKWENGIEGNVKWALEMYDHRERRELLLKEALGRVATVCEISGSGSPEACADEILEKIKTLRRVTEEQTDAKIEFALQNDQMHSALGRIAIDFDVLGEIEFETIADQVIEAHREGRRASEILMESLQQLQDGLKETGGMELTDGIHTLVARLKTAQKEVDGHHATNKTLCSQINEALTYSEPKTIGDGVPALIERLNRGGDELKKETLARLESTRHNRKLVSEFNRLYVVFNPDRDVLEIDALVDMILLKHAEPNPRILELEQRDHKLVGALDAIATALQVGDLDRNLVDLQAECLVAARDGQGAIAGRDAAMTTIALFNPAYATKTDMESSVKSIIDDIRNLNGLLGEMGQTRDNLRENLTQIAEACEIVLHHPFPELTTIILERIAGGQGAIAGRDELLADRKALLDIIVGFSPVLAGETLEEVARRVVARIKNEHITNDMLEAERDALREQIRLLRAPLDITAAYPASEIIGMVLQRLEENATEVESHHATAEAFQKEITEAMGMIILARGSMAGKGVHDHDIVGGVRILLESLVYLKGNFDVLESNAAKHDERCVELARFLDEAKETQRLTSNLEQKWRACLGRLMNALDLSGELQPEAAIEVVIAKYRQAQQAQPAQPAQTVRLDIPPALLGVMSELIQAGQLKIQDDLRAQREPPVSEAGFPEKLPPTQTDIKRFLGPRKPEGGHPARLPGCEIVEGLFTGRHCLWQQGHAGECMPCGIIGVHQAPCVPIPANSRFGPQVEVHKTEEAHKFGEGPGLSVCTHCQHPNPPNTEFCNACKMNVRGEIPESYKVVEPGDTMHLICQYCSHANPVSDSVCQRCYKELS